MFLYPTQFSKLISATTELVTAQARLTTALTADLVAESTRLSRTTILGSSKAAKTAKGKNFEIKEPGLKDMGASAAHVWIRNSRTVAEETAKFWSSSMDAASLSEAKTATNPADFAMDFSDWSRIWMKPFENNGTRFTPSSWPGEWQNLFTSGLATAGLAQKPPAKLLFPQFPFNSGPTAGFPFVPGQIPGYDEILKSWRMGHEYLKWSNRTAEWQRIFASGPLGSLMGSLNPWIPNLNSSPNLWTPSAASAFEPFMKPFAPGFNGSQPMQELNVMSPFMIWQWSDQQRRA